jgi:hypothetical protein
MWCATFRNPQHALETCWFVLNVSDYRTSASSQQTEMCCVFALTWVTSASWSTSFFLKKKTKNKQTKLRDGILTIGHGRMSEKKKTPNTGAAAWKATRINGTC